MNSPAVSIVCAFHNEVRVIGPTLQSISQQTFRDFEVIFIDDGSSDETSDKIRFEANFDFTIIRNEQKFGLSRSLNRGLLKAKAPLIARLDADDVMHPERLALQFKEFDRDSNLVLLGAQAVKIDDDGRLFGEMRMPESNADCRFALNFYSPVIHPLAMYRTDAVRSIGGYDENFASAQDYRLWTRLSSYGSIRNLPDTLLQYRVRQSQSITSSRRSEQMRKHAFIVRNFFLPGRPTVGGVSLHLRRFARILGLMSPQDRTYLFAKMARVLREG